jgi:hypothetical protein
MLLVACAGCWEKIEYKGPRTVSTSKQQSPEPAAQIPATNPQESPADDIFREDPPLVASADAPATENPPPEPVTPDAPEPAASSAPSTEAADDRYATPPAAENPAAEPPSDLFPPSEPLVAPGTVAAEDSASDHPPGILPSDSPPATVTTEGSQPASPTEPPVVAANPAAAPAANDAQPLPSDTAAATTGDAAQKPPALNPRRAAWLLGSWLSLAALANDRGVAVQNVPTWLEYSRKAAFFLST